MAAAKKLTAAILAKRASKGSRGKRTRPGTRQYTVADLERATQAIPTGDARGWSGRSSNYTSSRRNYACVASLSDVLDQASPTGPASIARPSVVRYQ